MRDLAWQYPQRLQWEKHDELNLGWNEARAEGSQRKYDAGVPFLTYIDSVPGPGSRGVLQPL